MACVPTENKVTPKRSGHDFAHPWAYCCTSTRLLGDWNIGLYDISLSKDINIVESTRKEKDHLPGDIKAAIPWLAKSALAKMTSKVKPSRAFGLDGNDVAPKSKFELLR